MFKHVENRVIATARHSLEAAAALFRENGIEPVILGDSITGEAREVAKVMAALALGLELAGTADVHAIAADTDGIDGSENNAGALLAPDSMSRASAQGIDTRKFLAANDSYGVFSALGDLVVTGPTRTNVNDYRAILITRAL